MKGAKRVILGLAGLGMAAALGGCGILRGAGNTATDLNPEDDTYYTMWIHSGPGSSYYTEYEDNPAVKYAETMTWGEEGKSIFIDFVIPPANKEPDDLQNMYINGNLTHVLDGVICDSADIMYANNRIIDLTEYVNQYMPNYKKVLDTVEDVRKSAVFNIDGEEKILGIVTVNESYKDVNFGYEYRRDWIVKYGSNPQTGAAFSGGYTDESDPDSWEDDVVFPSGGSDPVYISDWEWMFGIFETAMEDMGIDDGYCISMYYPGYMWSGGLCSSFGGGTPMFYVNDQGQACFGGVSDSFRTYLECLSAWYEKGWLDKTFDQKTSDAHYAIDSAKIHQGKIGIWYGQQSTLGNRIYNQNDPSQTPLAEGIFVAGAPMPINDIYGPEECRNVIPDCTAAGVGMQGSPVYITTKAVEDGKDIAALCAFFDYFYTEEGAVVKTVGLNQEQVQASGSDFYEKNGLTEGAYTNVSDGKDSPGKGTEEKEKGHFSGRAYPWLINYGGTIDLIGTILPSIHKYEFAWDEKKKGLYLAAQPPVHEGLAPEVNGYRWTDAVDGWIYEGYEGKPTWVDAYTDAAEVEIFINGTSAGRSPVKDYYAKVPCFYQPGELLGVGYDGNGKELYRTSVRTAGQETEICAVPDKTILQAGEEDFCFIDISVTDSRGRLKLLPERKVEIRIEGAGSIQGFGSANHLNEENIKMEKYRDSSLSPKERAQDLLGRMSLEEKMGQVNCLFPYGDNWDAVEKDMEHGIGQVSTLDVRVIKSLEEAAAWQRRIQEKVMEKSEHGIPAVFHMEGLCGPFIQDSMSFCSCEIKK